MGRKSKEDDRTEKILRGLLRLPENRRCVNCNSLGPQYVCTTFWTFVCTNCSGIHREFTHRVKSVSMAKFSPEEINELQSRGNEQARRIYLRTWDPVHDGFPSSSNLSLTRDFIKRVYVERRYTGDHPGSQSRFQRSKPSDRDESYGARSKCGSESFRDKRSEDIVGDDSKILRRSATQMFTTADLPKDRYSPRDPPTFQRNRGFQTSPSRSPIFGDNFLNLQARNQQLKSAEDRKTDKPVCPKRIAPPGSQSGNAGAANLQVQKIAPPSNHSVNSGAANTTKKGSDAESSPTKQEPEKGSKEPAMGDLLSQDGEVDPASQNPPEEKKVSAAPPPKDPLEFLLLELCTPANTPSDDKPGPSTTVGNNGAQLETTDSKPQTTDTAPVTTLSSSNAEAFSPDLFASWPSNDTQSPLPNNGVASHDPSTSQNPALPDADHAEAKEMPPQSVDSGAPHGSGANFQSPCGGGDGGGGHNMSSHVTGLLLPANTNSSSGGPSAHGEEGRPGPVANSHSSTPDYASKALVLHSTQPQDASLPSSHPSDGTLKFQPESSGSLASPGTNCFTQQAQGANSNGHCNPSLALANSNNYCNPSPAQANSTGRMELPEDIFTSLYTPGPAATGHGWQAFPNYGMGFNMQCHNVVAQRPPPALSHAPKSWNPFDLDETAQGHGAMLPPRVSAPGLLHDVAAVQGISSSSYAPQSAAPGVPNMGQNFFNNNMGIARLHTREGSANGGTDMFGAFTPTNQQQVGYGGFYSAPATAPAGGRNPFG